VKYDVGHGRHGRAPARRRVSPRGTAAMRLADRVAVVTGGASGIGRALCRRFAAEGARGIVVADRDAAGAEAVAKEIGGLAVATDVAVEAEVVRLVERAAAAYDRIDLFCSNAGIGGTPGGVEVPDEVWRRMWDVNVMAHIHAARAVLPGMLARGEGYLLQTASAAGLLTQVGSAPYSVTKHAAVAFAEWLAITYGDAGITVSCLCPQGVRTRMLLGDDGARESFLLEGALEPEDVAEAVVRGLAAETFLILPHPEVAEYFRRKALDYDRWLRGMRRLRARVRGQA
jgi:NAD(P)-dependent dehydrogenase (short-subunit alcohol dehydrogenase family)